MHPSIAHVPRVSGDKTAAETERDDLRDLLAAVLETLTTPDTAPPDATLLLRVMAVRGTLRDVLDGNATLGIPWETAYLRKETARLAMRETADGKGEYLYCGADLGRYEYPFTCNRRIGHGDQCSGDRDA